MTIRYLCAFLLIGTLIGGCKKAPPNPSGVTEKAVGLPFYPSSTEWGTGSRVTEEGRDVLAASARETNDPPDKVIAFYKKKIQGPQVTSSNVGDIVHTNIIGRTSDGSDAEVLVMKLPQQRTQIFLSVRRTKK